VESSESQELLQAGRGNRRARRLGLARRPGCRHVLCVRVTSKLILCASFVLCARFSLAADWKVIRLQDRDYVSFANVAQFYRFPQYTRVNRDVSLRNNRRGLRAQAGTSELNINGVRFFTDFPILANSDDTLVSAMDVSKIIEPILRPNRIHNAQKVETVVLDPGHGGDDQGAAGEWGTEKEFALDVALTAREQLQHAGFKVEMTRSGDVARSLEERVDFANRFSNAVLISIHFNTSNGGAGVESYALAPAGVRSNAATENHASVTDTQACLGNVQDEQNMALAAAVHGAVLSRVSVFDRGVHHARFHVLRNIVIPGVLLEGGFLSHHEEGRRIATPQYRRQLGLAIAQAVQNYDAAVNFRSGGATLAVATNNLPPHEHSITEPLREDIPPAPNHVDKPSISIDAGQ
jgi:N-acetylmuramoyl-L-alanine amidase